MPELPEAKKERLLHRYGLTEYEVNLLTETRAKAEFFEECLASLADAEETAVRQRAKAVGNWILGDFAHLLNAANMEVDDAPVKPEHIAQMLDMIDSGVISGKIAKTVFEQMFQTGNPPSQIVQEAGLTQISASDQLAAAVEKVLAVNAKAVRDYQSGKQEALRFLVGQVMRETRGRANPGLVNDILREKLVGGG
jgi:aspartyl-tRNA(Asn)/glutamyl-tRNA(Gln) amidotransferase subunit B